MDVGAGWIAVAERGGRHAAAAASGACFSGPSTALVSGREADRFLRSARREPDADLRTPFDGGPIKQVSNGEGSKEGDLDPTWSPDGASLAFGGSSTEGSAARIHVIDLKSGHISALPGSEGMWSPHWSPDGQSIAGLTTSNLNIVLYNLQTRKQSELFGLSNAYPNWSRDGEYLFFETIGNEGWCRVRIRDRKAERIVPLKNIPVQSWFAQGPNNSLIATRLAGADEIYALDWVRQ